MTILFALVARGSVVLAEFSGTSTNASAIARQILDKIPGNNDSNVSYSQDRYIFHVKRTDGLTVLCMADDTAGSETFLRLVALICVDLFCVLSFWAQVCLINSSSKPNFFRNILKFLWIFFPWLIGRSCVLLHLEVNKLSVWLWGHHSSDCCRLHEFSKSNFSPVATLGLFIWNYQFPRTSVLMQD